MQADVILVIGANPTDGHPVFASQMKRRLRAGREADRRRPAPDRPRAHAARRGGLPPAAAARHQRRARSTRWRTSIVTEGLRRRGRSSRERCDAADFDALARVHRRASATRPRRSRRSPACRPPSCAPPRGSTPPAATAAIYYGLGVTEHSQGSTMVMGMANLAMATGNIGREGVGVNPLRGQNNVQGSCDMGSFPHEFSGYRHVSRRRGARRCSRQLWGVALEAEPGLRIPNMFDAALDGTLQGPLRPGRGHRAVRPQHPARRPRRSRRWNASSSRTCSSTRRPSYAHVFLPGSSFLEKDGTFTNAERRI